MNDFSAIRVEQVNLNGEPLFLRVTALAMLDAKSMIRIRDQLTAFVKELGLDVPVLLLPNGWQAEVAADEPLVTSLTHPLSTATT